MLLRAKAREKIVRPKGEKKSKLSQLKRRYGNNNLTLNSLNLNPSHGMEDNEHESGLMKDNVLFFSKDNIDNYSASPTLLSGKEYLYQQYHQ